MFLHYMLILLNILIFKKKKLLGRGAILDLPTFPPLLILNCKSCTFNAGVEGIGNVHAVQLIAKFGKSIVVCYYWRCVFPQPFLNLALKVCFWIIVCTLLCRHTRKFITIC